MTDKQAALEIMKAIGDALRALGSVPSGHFYARLIAMPGMANLTADQFQQILGTFKRAGLLKEENYMLTWVGR